MSMTLAFTNRVHTLCRVLIVPFFSKTRLQGRSSALRHPVEGSQER